MTVASSIKAIIDAEVDDDATALSDLITGVVETRALVRPPSKGPTPGAWDDAGRTLVSIVVRGREELADPLGPLDSGLGLRAIQTFPQIYIYGPPTASGKAAIEAVYAEIKRLFLFRSLEGDGGTGVELQIIGYSAPDDDPELQATVVAIVRLQGSGFWAIAPDSQHLLLLINWTP